MASNGGIILTGAAGVVGSVYAAAYLFYLNLIEQDKAANEAKSAKAAERRATVQKQKEVEETAKSKEKAADEDRQAQVAEQAALQKKKEAEQATKDADDKMRLEKLKADEKEPAEKAEAGNDDADASDKKSPRRRFRFWKK